MEKLSEGEEPIHSRFAYTIKGISDIIENSTFIDIISTQPTNKSAEIKQEKSNQSLNLTATNDIQSSQAISENKTSDAKLESDNKTIEQITVANFQKSKPLNKNILLLGIIIFAAFLTTLLIIFKIRKMK